MAKTHQNEIALKLRDYAQKLASNKAAETEKAAAGEGAPDRMTVADGQGGVTTEKKTVPHDVGEDELKRDQPTDGKNREVAKVPAGAPDRMTCADGHGGVTTSKTGIPKDPGEAEVKADQPVDGDVRKAATISESAARIRAALSKANPEFAARIQKEAGNQKALEAKKPEVAEKKAGSAEQPAINLSEATLSKIASSILSTDEGASFVYNLFEKQAGEEAARSKIQEAIQAAQSFEQEDYVKQASFADLQEKTEAIYGQLKQAGVTEKDAHEILEKSALHQEKMASFGHPLLKMAYAQGMDDAALLAAAEEGEGVEGAAPVEEAMPLGGAELGQEEILALLEEMLASGEITEQDIKEAVAMTEGGGGEELPVDPAAAMPAEEEVAMV